MAFYPEEEEHVGKCPRHPSKRRRSGVCPACLKDRLAALCPDCAHVRHCCCCATSSSTSTSSSSSSSSSNFSLHFSDGRISTLIAAEPSFRRSKSAAATSSFLRSSSKFSAGDDRRIPVPENRSKSSSIWSVFSWQKMRREKMEGSSTDDEKKMKLRKSRSVAAGNEMRSSPAAGKGKAWYFPSPMKVFRQAKAWKFIVQERSSPLQRG